MKSEIESLLAAEDWQGARAAILDELQGDPENHWLLTRLGATYYEEKDYATALVFTDKALLLAPKCPLVRWDYACCMDMLGYDDPAFREFASIALQDENELAYGDCGEGSRWAKSLQADCYYRMAYLSRCRVTKHLCAKWHQYLRTRGAESIYSDEEVEQLLAAIHA